MSRSMNRRIRWTLLASLALLAALGLPQPAAAGCGFLCMEVSPLCDRCVYIGEPSVGCINYPGNCGCYDENNCGWATSPSDPREQAALTSIGFLPTDLQPGQCSAEAPAETVGD